MSSFVTEWTAILPISYQWSESTTDSNVIDGKNCFGDTVEQPRTKLYFFNYEKLFQRLDRKSKVENINVLRENLQRYMSGLQEEDLENSVILVEAESNILNNLELFSKALFAQIAEINYSKEYPIALRIAILFEHIDALFEFIRLFAVFYDKDTQSVMKNVQIALCKKNVFYGDIYDVAVMLAGAQLSSSYGYARLFAYNQTENELEYLPLVEYLTMQNNQKEAEKQTVEDIRLFPFELYIPIDFRDHESQDLDWHHSWFLQKMKHILNTNIQDKSYGCLVDDIHIRLGSKLHLNRFYEAELLFHNMGNVIRFAYIIAQELLYGEGKLLKDQPVLLLGYEKYSSMLLMQIEYWIKKSNQFTNVDVAIVYDSDNEKEVKVRPYFDKEQDICLGSGNVQIVTVVPVGTTLSTVYKMLNVSQTQLQKYFGSERPDQTRNTNFCLILVNNNLGTYSDLSAITSRYWDNIMRDKQIVTLNMEQANGSTIQVRYFINAEAEWLDPLNCPVCRNSGKYIRPIIDGKHSNTMPGAIFSLWGPHAGTFGKLVKNEKENRDRIRSLYGNVFYSHIYHGNNHFQFYIDFKQLYEENKEAIDLYLCKKRVKQDCFHVIVSPLQLTNSTFVKAVIDNAFNGNVRFLHINIQDAYREEIRAKFSHITQEFRAMRHTNPQAKIAFHFVDTSIVMGNQLNRARLLIKMLLNQSGIHYDDVRLFDKVFLLVNRCSYDTANYFVHKPEENMHAYIHLAIPSYNTENDFCPACKLTAKFQLLGKRSSTERLSREFLRLQEKHKKRTFETYQSWLIGNSQYGGMSAKGNVAEKDGVLLTSPAYLGWLKQWLYVNAPASQTRLLSFIPKESEEHEKKSGTLASELQQVKIIKEGLEKYAESSKAWESKNIQWGKQADKEQLRERNDYLDRLSNTNLNHIAKYISNETQKAEFLSSAVNIIKLRLLGVRDYMRLKAMQQSYEELEKIQFEHDSMKKARYRETILRLIGEAIVSRDEKDIKSQLNGLKETEKDRFLLTYNVEWLISYIKVLSRAQIVNYYEYRQAIVGVMSDMLRVLARRDLYDKFIKTVEGENVSGNTVSEDWEKIVRLLGFIREYDGAFEDHQLCAKLCYQVHMTLMHRTADLQISSRVDADEIISTMKLYSEMIDCYFKSKPIDDIPYIDMPSASKNMIRYLKAAKSATMTSNDDVPCLILASTPDKLMHELRKNQNINAEQNLRNVAQYIYLENTRMLYSGMIDIRKRIASEVFQDIESYRPADSFSEYMEKLSRAVEECLNHCYRALGQEAKEEDLLYQNLLSNFCRFWHKSTGEAPVEKTDEINPIAYLLLYFIRLDDMLNQTGKGPNNDELPYLYEELCRILCGITGFQMCYLTYCHAGNYPEIFAQSGYHVELMMSGKLLTPVRMDEIIRLAQDKNNELLSGITKITANRDCDYLVLFIPLIGDMESNDGFYIVLQSDTGKKIFDNDNPKPDWKALRKARDVLFLRKRLQEALSRDYTVLVNYRFDCSYVRPISKDTNGHPVAMHISDLHIQHDMSSQANNICNEIEAALRKSGTDDKPIKIDLLIISGDIVDSKDANAPRIEQNYHYAEQLLDQVVSTLWKDESGYLPHDWRRRIIVTTGNHDYASMNQYQAMQKGRVLTSAFPVDGESGTMSKFSYYIEFLIHYLDAPVDQLLYNDLNEIRYYQKLNLKLLILNCSGNATPRRTNKMGINYEKVRELLKRSVWKSQDEKICDEHGKILKREPFRLVIGHYSPQYKLSYFLDKYGILPGWVWEPEDDNEELKNRPVNRLIKTFQDAVQAELRYRFSNEGDKNSIRKIFMEEFESLNKAMQILEEPGKRSPDVEMDNYCKRLMSAANSVPISKSKNEAGKEFVQKMKENKLYQQLERYYNWLKTVYVKKSKEQGEDVYDNNFEEWSEEISKLLYEVGESIRMGEQDKELFFDFIGRELNDRDLYLAGHIHAYAEDEANHILVADKLFDQSRTEIHGYIIQNLVKGTGDDKPHYISERFGTKKPSSTQISQKEETE